MLLHRDKNRPFARHLYDWSPVDSGAKSNLAVADWASRAKQGRAAEGPAIRLSQYGRAAPARSSLSGVLHVPDRGSFVPRSRLPWSSAPVMGLL